MPQLNVVDSSCIGVAATSVADMLVSAAWFGLVCVLAKGCESCSSPKTTKVDLNTGNHVQKSEKFTIDKREVRYEGYVKDLGRVDRIFG